MEFYMNFVDKCFNPFSVVLPVLVATAFFTLAERKVLASVQRRVGPMNVGFLGILQPIADGLKLLTKQYVIPASFNKLLWFFIPFFSLWFSFIGWYAINSNHFFI
jgi:NADH:ubiquinone oxidoreductase subunit H